MSGPAPSGGAPVRGRAAAVGPHGTPPLIGRANELAVLDRAFAGACTGRGRLVVLAGQAGIGKTRLASEAAASSADHGAWTAWGRGTEVEGAPPSWFWSQIIRALLAMGEPDELRRALGPEAAEIARIVPEVTELSGDTARPWPADPATARFRLYEAVVAFLARLAARRPLVLVLDDLHWADVSSLELTELLVQRLPDLPILLIVTYRDREAVSASAVTVTLGTLARSSVLDRLPLAGFSELEVGTFVAQATGVEPASEVVAAVYARTEGNPFFVAELARSLTDEGGLDDPATSVRKVPSGIKDVLRRRVDAFAGPTRTLLATAAVAGREFDLALAATATDVTLDQAVELLDPAVAVGLVEEDPQAVGRYRFSHVLVRDAIYDEIVGLRRARLHGRVGNALAGRDDDSLGLVTELARHFHLAAPAVGPAPGTAAAIRAAGASEAVLAFEQAEAYLKQALDLVATMPPGDERDRLELELQLRIGSLISRTRGRSWPEVAGAFNRAQQICGRIGLTADHLRTLWGQFFVAYVTADLEGAAAVGAQLLDLGRQAGDPRCELAGLVAVGTSKFYLGQLAQARAHLTQAASLADALADPSLADLFIQDPRVASRNLLVLATWLLGDYDGADDVVAEQIRVIEAVDHPHSELGALVCHGWLRLMQRDPVRLEEVCARTLSLATQLGHQPISLAIGMHQGWAIAHRGATQAGASMVRRTRDDLDALRMAAARPCFLGMLAEAELLDGRPEAALAAIDAALDEVGRRGDRFYLPELHRVKGEILLTSGSDADAMAARACFQRALDEAEAQGAVALRDRAARSLAGIPAPAPPNRRGNQVASAPGMLA